MSVKKTLWSLLLLVVISVSSTAQIATPEGEIQGGNRKDTAHFVDRPSMHVHEKIIVVDKKAKEHSKSEANKSGQSKQTDTAQQAQQSPPSGDSISGLNGANENGGGTMASINATETTPVGMQQNINPIYAALTTLGIGALIGLFLLVMLLRNQKTSKWMALLHGALGLVGIGILITYSMFFQGIIVAVVILAIAATGGLIVFYKDISGQPIPKWLAVTHGIVAIAGIVVLVVFAISK